MQSPKCRSPWRCKYSPRHRSFASYRRGFFAAWRCYFQFTKSYGQGQHKCFRNVRGNDHFPFHTGLHLTIGFYSQTVCSFRNFRHFEKAAPILLVNKLDNTETLYIWQTAVMWNFKVVYLFRPHSVWLPLSLYTGWCVGITQLEASSHYDCSYGMLYD